MLTKDAVVISEGVFVVKGTQAHQSYSSVSSSEARLLGGVAQIQ